LWKSERDPIANFGKWLVEQKLADAAALEQMRAELEAEMKKAVDFAVAAPYPTIDEVGEDVYA
jgi:pyruvate dehydrogenase E1 component alpha subunit